MSTNPSLTMKRVPHGSGEPVDPAPRFSWLWYKRPCRCGAEWRAYLGPDTTNPRDCFRCLQTARTLLQIMYNLSQLPELGGPRVERPKGGASHYHDENFGAEIMFVQRNGRTRVSVMAEDDAGRAAARSTAARVRARDAD
jgi:hypothetical protein